MSHPHFHDLLVQRITPEAGGAVAITFAIPEAIAAAFAFVPGQFLTLRATIDGADVRRSYSICSPLSHYAQRRELTVGIRAVDGGVFSNWAARQVRVNDRMAVMPPDGRFVSRKPRALHRVGFAAGSGITPILSLMWSTLESQPDSRFTLVYGNQRMSTVMFNEALQDLKDRYPDRLTLIHILSRQAQEVPLLEGRIDAAKVRAIVDALLPVASMDEVFICGPEAMILATETALTDAGVPAHRVHSERFASAHASAPDTRPALPTGVPGTGDPVAARSVALTIVLDGKPHALTLSPSERILDVALAAGLDLPYSCKGGVCCTCRAKVMEGRVTMDKNFTLEPWETQQGFVLSCQARPATASVVLSFDER
jgi:ring-1,2-phenylacetyl-CoA epoxidase subunit PaaE